MHEDEDFAASIRPPSIFGAVGTSDSFEEDDYQELDGLEEFDDEDFEPLPAAPVYRNASPAPSRAIPRRYPNAVGSAPVAVSGTGSAETQDGSKLGAAITLFMILGGAGIGWHFGKFKGATGGALAGGALRNLYRTHKTITTGGDTETAVKQGIIGILGVAGGGYLLWTANRK